MFNDALLWIANLQTKCIFQSLSNCNSSFQRRGWDGCPQWGRVAHTHLNCLHKSTPDQRNPSFYLIICKVWRYKAAEGCDPFINDVNPETYPWLINGSQEEREWPNLILLGRRAVPGQASVPIGEDLWCPSLSHLPSTFAPTWPSCHYRLPI